jgi:hypothetical protein
MSEPERRYPRPNVPGTPERPSPSPGERRRLIRAAALRPINVAMLVVGGGVFATTLAWWVLPLTLLTYATLVFLAVRDPNFGRRILEGRRASSATASHRNAADVSPERRARWLPRGETRQRVEAALAVYRKVVAAIEESDDVARSVLGDAVPKLHAAADRLVDVAENREEAAAVISDLRAAGEGHSEDRASSLRELEHELRTADAEISGTSERLLALRARVVRISIDSGPAARVAAENLNSSLDELNFRLEALGTTMSPPEDQRPGR